jgi:hypothetical protein
MLFGRDAVPTTPADQAAQASPAAAPVTEEPVASPPPAPSSPSAPPPTTGSLLVRSTPTRAGVLIDRVWRGRTPLTLRDLTFGQHDVRVVLEGGYEPINQRITLTPDNASRELSFELRRIAGERGGRSAPPAAQPSRETAPPAGTPAPATSGLSVSSLPAGARVTVDGRFVGITPLSLPDLTPGGHRVTVELEGYLPYTATAIVNPNRVTRVAARLQPR